MKFNLKKKKNKKNLKSHLLQAQLIIIDFSLDIGIYEPQFTYKEMKQLLGFINESQDTSKVANNKDTHKVCNYHYHINYDIL